MKEILTILLITIFINTDANPISAKSVIDSTVSVVKSTTNTAVTAVTDAKNYTDTSSLFREMYNDGKKAVIVLANQFKTTTEQVLTIIGKKYFIEGIFNLIIFTFSFIVFLTVVFNVKKWTIYTWNNTQEGLGLIPLSIVLFCVSTFTLCEMYHCLYTGLQYTLNPQYYVLQDIVNIVKSFK